MKEVQQTIGGSFTGYSTNSIYTDNANASRRSQQQQSSTTGDSSNAIPDMGILKTLSEMGDEMKKQLNQLALKFNASTSGSSGSSSDYRRGYNDGGETQSMLSAAYEVLLYI